MSIQASLSMRSQTHDPSFLYPRKAARIGKPTGDLDVIELCKRLEEIRRHQRAATWSGRSKAAEMERAPTKVGEPYRHIPQTAATDFTRTTTPALGRSTRSHRLSAPLILSPTNIKSEKNVTGKLEKRLSEGSDGESTECQKSLCNRMSIASTQPATRSQHRPGSDQGLLRRRTTLKDRSTTRKETRSKTADKQTGHVYRSLLEADARFQMLSMGDIDHTDLEGIDLGLRQDAPALAHRITRQHLDDRTNWTQSDASNGEGKHLLRYFMNPLIRVKISKQSSSDGLTAPCSEI
ncbi:MAG: hypothetical protein Q9191_006621, partial [Dirinaria sp. TL-2023a]